MRNLPPILLIVLAAAAGYLLLTGGDEPVTTLGPLDDDPDDASAQSPGPLEAAPGMTPTGRPKAPPRRGSLPVVDPRTVPRGTLLVRPVDSEGQAIDPRYLTVEVDPLARKDWLHRLGQSNAETGMWTFRKVLTGPVRVRVFGDHVLAATARAEVQTDRTNEVQVTVQRAGAIGYDVVYPDGSRPVEVTLTLFDAQDQPVKAWFQARSPRESGKARHVLEAKQGPQGVVYSLRPGRYRLRAVNEEGVYADQTVDVTLDGTQAVRFNLPR